jgi:hypothetical protein
MAIQHRALVALSIAFTASIVACAALPPDIPHVRNVFVGRLFLAFLLPITATVIWQLLSTLHCRALRHLPGTPTRSERIGPTTVLFLSAFHVTMLIALGGAHLWLGRILGVMAGIFLMATGNELPRLRPNSFWGSCARQTFGGDDVWRRVHRLGGYIRVVSGLAVSLAALVGMRGFAELIVVAVGLEVVACAVATMFLLNAQDASVLPRGL